MMGSERIFTRCENNKYIEQNYVLIVSKHSSKVKSIERERSITYGHGWKRIILLLLSAKNKLHCWTFLWFIGFWDEHFWTLGILMWDQSFSIKA